jgi:hypothetical protein
VSAHELKSVREDESSIFYTFCEGGVGVTLTVLKVGEEHIGCDLTMHMPSPYRGEPCAVWGGLSATCTGVSGGFVRAFYRNLQHDTSQRVDDEVVFAALAARVAHERGDDA